MEQNQPSAYKPLARGQRPESVIISGPSFLQSPSTSRNKLSMPDPHSMLIPPTSGKVCPSVTDLPNFQTPEKVIKILVSLLPEFPPLSKQTVPLVLL